MDTDKQINRTHEAGILEAIKNHPIFCFNDIFGFYVACSRRTAYEHNLHESHDIKEAIFANRRKEVTSLKAKWLKSDNATLQLAAMRMICEPEEHKALQMNYIDHTTKGKEIKQVIIELPPEETDE